MFSHDESSLPAREAGAGKLLIFDLDGVITSEDIYLEAARYTLQELIQSRDYLSVTPYFRRGADSAAVDAESILPFPLINAVKKRAVNSNWDLCYIAATLHILAIIAKLNADGFDVPNAEASLEALFASIRGEAKRGAFHPDGSDRMIALFVEALDARQNVSPLLFLPQFLQSALGQRLVCLEPGGELWGLCYALFQDWIGGQRKSAYAETLPAINLTCETAVDCAELQTALGRLRRAGYVLGIATGRPRQETLVPLHTMGLLSYFDAARIVTYDDVVEAEERSAASQPGVKLGKPHPFVLLKAMQPDAPLAELTDENFAGTSRKEAVFIGDSAADILAAKRAGCRSFGVLTGAGWNAETRSIKRQALTDLGCEQILNDVLELPDALGAE